MQIYNAEIARWLLDITPLFSIQLLAVLFLRKTVLRRFGAKVTYQLWLLPPVWYLFSLLLSLSVDIATPELNLMPRTIPAISTILMDSFVAAPNVDGIEIVQSTSRQSFDFPWSLLFYVWLTGFMACVAYHTIRVFRFRSLLIRSGRKVDAGCSLDVVLEAGFPKAVRVWRLQNLSAPALYGIHNFQLLLPENFTTHYDVLQQQAMLAHELVHYRRQDNRINLLALLLRSVFWFNPVFYIAHRFFRLDQELSCDAQVLEISTRQQRKAYARALMDSASGNEYPNFGLGLSGWENLIDFKERTAMLNVHHKVRMSQNRKVLFFCGLTLVGTIACTAITANSSEQSAAVAGTSGLLPAQVIPAEIFSILNETNQASIEATRDSLQSVPADSEYVAFVIDSSGSMTNNPSWSSVLRQVENTLNLYPELKGIQLINDMGDYLLYPSHGQWIEDTAENRDEILSALRLWNAYSNSSPMEGIAKVIAELASEEKEISIYVLGDDFQPDLDLNEALGEIDRIIAEGAGVGKLVRIHGIAFPTIFFGPERFQGSADKYIAYMLALTRQHGGTFEIVDLAWNSQADRVVSNLQ